jgi:hypothetical protein
VRSSWFARVGPHGRILVDSCPRRPSPHDARRISLLPVSGRDASSAPISGRRSHAEKARHTETVVLEPEQDFEWPTSGPTYELTLDGSPDASSDDAVPSRWGGNQKDRPLHASIFEPLPAERLQSVAEAMSQRPIAFSPIAWLPSLCSSAGVGSRCLDRGRTQPK